MRSQPLREALPSPSLDRVRHQLRAPFPQQPHHRVVRVRLDGGVQRRQSPGVRRVQVRACVGDGADHIRRRSRHDGVQRVHLPPLTARVRAGAPAEPTSSRGGFGLRVRLEGPGAAREVVRVRSRGEVPDELALVVSRGELSQAVGDAVGDDALVRSLLDVTVQGGAHLHQGVRRLLLVGLDRQHERRVQVGVHGVHVCAELLERDDGEDVSGSRAAKWSGVMRLRGSCDVAGTPPRSTISWMSSVSSSAAARHSLFTRRMGNGAGQRRGGACRLDLSGVLDSCFGRFAEARGCGVGALAAGLLTASRPAAYPDMVVGERRADALRGDPRAPTRCLGSRARSLPRCRPTEPTAGRHDLVTSQKKPRGSRKARGHPPSISPAIADPRRSHGAEEEQTDQALEGRRFDVLLGALMRDVPDLFEAEVLSKLGVKDHFRLAQVNKACRDVVYKLGPVEFMRSCDVSDEVDRLRSDRLPAWRAALMF